MNAGKSMQRGIGIIFWASLYPFLAFYAHNVTESYYFASIFSVMAVIFTLVLAVYFLGIKCLPKLSPERIAVGLAFAIIASFSFHHVEFATAHIGIYLGTIKILIWTVIVLLALLSGLVLGKSGNAAKIIMAMIVGLNIIPFMTATSSLYNQFSHKQSVDSMLSKDVSENSAQRNYPNVYWLILDMYSRHDVLKEYYDYDNMPFISAMRERGFYVSDHSYSNYQSTRLSLSTTLNMDYYLPVKEEMNPLSWQTKLQGGNRTVDKFRSLGYSYIHLEPGGNTLKTRCGGGEDLCVHGPQRGTFSLNEAHVGMMKMTPFYRILKNKKSNLFTFDFTTIEDIKSHIDPKKRRPFFAFMHILSPHPPARFDSECNYRERTEWELLEYSDPQADKNYINDMKCLNQRVLDFVDWVKENDPEALMIVQADHGRSVNSPEAEFTDDELVSKEHWHKSHAIFSSFRVPDNCKKGLYATMSPVNNFPFIFSCLENAEFRPLPDRKFVIHGKKEYKMFPEELYEIENPY